MAAGTRVTDSMTATKPIIGLCGGVGAGKSRVAAEFQRAGCLVIDSDRLNHEVLRRPEVLATLREWWGEQVVGPDGTSDRKRIAEIVFADPDQKRRLEGLVYPLIAEIRAAMIRKVNEDRAVKAIILDSPLLLESNLDRLCDAIVFVNASRPRRLQRLQQARDWSAEELRQREQWQRPLTDKRSRADFVIDNDGPPERLPPQVSDILMRVITRNPARQ
jgi:dephospho-CoA kinase